jgi:hypothetical protein
MAYNFAHYVVLPTSRGTPTRSSWIRRRKRPTAAWAVSIRTAPVRDHIAGDLVLTRLMVG